MNKLRAILENLSFFKEETAKLNEENKILK